MTPAREGEGAAVRMRPMLVEDRRLPDKPDLVWMPEAADEICSPSGITWYVETTEAGGFYGLQSRKALRRFHISKMLKWRYVRRADGGPITVQACADDLGGKAGV